MRYWLTVLALLFVGAINSQAAVLGTVGTSTNFTMFTGAEGAVNSTSVANFFPLSGVFTPAAAAAEGNVLQNTTLSGTVSNLSCYLTVAGGTKTVAGGTNYVIAFRDNQADSTLTCTIAAGASACTDATHSVAVAAADQLDFGATPNGTPTALEAHCSVTFVH